MLGTNLQIGEKSPNAKVNVSLSVIIKSLKTTKKNKSEFNNLVSDLFSVFYNNMIQYKLSGTKAENFFGQVQDIQN